MSDTDHILTPQSFLRRLFDQAIAKLQRLYIPYQSEEIAGALVPTNAFFPYLKDLFGENVSYLKTMRTIALFMRNSCWCVVWNENDSHIQVSSLMVRSVTRPVLMRRIIENTDWEVIEETSNGEELRIRKKRPAPSSTIPEPIEKRLASPTALNIEDITEVK